MMLATLRKDALISPDYETEQRILHMHPRGYGGKGRKYADTVVHLMRVFDCGSVLDYGCGEGSLGYALRRRAIECREFDPAVPGKDALPSFADLVVCTDVLEHVEIDRVSTVLAHMRALARKAVFLVVALEPSKKLLSDGRNAHITLQPAAWWMEKVAEQLTILDVEIPLPRLKNKPERPGKFWVGVCRP